MGYSTEFAGVVKVDPPLNEAEADYLRRFSGSRRMVRTRGPYFAEPGDNFGQGPAEDVLDSSHPDPSQPGLWCQWVPTADGAGIEWDGGEKFYYGAEWMTYLIDTFLKPGARARYVEGEYADPAFARFTFDHRCDGEVEAQGEDRGDRWLLVVADNEVAVRQGRVVYE